MDRKGTDAEGGRGGGRGRRLAVLVVVQNALVLACLLLTLYSCWYKEPPQPEKIVHIQVESFKVLTENQTLRFSHVKSKHRMRLGEQSDTIHIKCTGPYVWYMDVCYQATEGRGVLQLQVERLGTPVSSVVLDAAHGAASTEFCRGLHSLVYFRAKQAAQVHLSSNTGIIFRNVTMGLTYLLGNMCDY